MQHAAADQLSVQDAVTDVFNVQKDTVGDLSAAATKKLNSLRS